MVTKILIGYDGSDAARAAFDFAVEMAARYAAELHVVAVARPPDIAEDVETEALVASTRRHLKKALDALKPAVGDVAAHFDVKVGHPAEQIVVYAEGHGIDHIVMGHRGHSLFERWLIGSVARRVIAYAPCGVTVVRPRPAGDGTQASIGP